MSPSFIKFIKTCFSHYDDFDDFLSKVYFIMILDTCNTSAGIDIEGAESTFAHLFFNDFLKNNRIMLPLLSSISRLCVMHMLFL